MFNLKETGRVLLLFISLMLVVAPPARVMAAGHAKHRTLADVTAVGSSAGVKENIPANKQIKQKMNTQELASSERLASTVRPHKYILTIEPDLKEEIFSGQETIIVEIEKPTNAITINSADLSITKAELVAGGHKIAGKVRLKPQAEQAVIDLPHQILPGRCELILNFKGCLNNKLRGFYKAEYKDVEGNKQIMAATQMEPTDARRMFPCFDEPAFKASYVISAIVDPELTVISNSEIVSQKADGPHKKIVEFGETPKMSTYLVALVVGKMESTEAVVSQGVPIRVWTTVGRSHLGKYAQQVAAQLLPYFNSYFHIPYPAKKLDLIAVPEFEHGAMENLGAITFREPLLLLDEKSAPLVNKQHVAGTIAHEMAHMWFGDLVTMKWWNDIWLNEAFATWMSFKAIDHLYPEWHAWAEFSYWRDNALDTDALLSTRPILFPVKTPSDINEMFDEITYSKGSSILRMLEHYVGQWVFETGVDHYLAEHEFGNATTDDLWQAIQNVSRQPIVAMMSDWTSEPGYPLISASLSNDHKRLSISQARFVMSANVLVNNFAFPSKKEKVEEARVKGVWYVPTHIKTWGPASTTLHSDLSVEHERARTRLLKYSQESFTISTPAKVVFVNGGGYGFYVVDYADSNMAALVPMIRTKLSTGERNVLLRDQWFLARAGRDSISEYLDLTASFKDESDPAVMREMVGNIDDLNAYVIDDSRASFAKFICDRLMPSKQKLGWTAKPGESELSKLLRDSVMQALGTYGQDDATISEARNLFRQYVANHESVEPDVLDAITEIVAYNGGAEDYETIKKLWKDAKTPADEERNLSALSKFQKPELLKDTLALCLSAEIKKQQAPELLKDVLRNDAGKFMAWSFLKDNWTQIVGTFPISKFTNVIEACDSFVDPDNAADVKSFLSSHPVSEGKSVTARMLERLQINVRFSQHSGPEFRKWLSAH